jgi:hypothetical protein
MINEHILASLKCLYDLYVVGPRNMSFLEYILNILEICEICPTGRQAPAKQYRKSLKNRQPFKDKEASDV